MVKNAPVTQADLERDGAFHVRPAMIDGAGDRQQLLEDLAGRRVVLGLAGVNQIDQQFRRDVAVADKQAVDIEHGRQQPLIMARQDLQIRLRLLKFGDLDIPAFHVAHAVLCRDDAFLGSDFKLCFQVVAGLGGVGVLEQDLLQARGLPDRLVPILGRALLKAEAQPAVVRVDKRPGRTGILALPGFFGGYLRAFARDARDDRDINGVGIGADQIEALAFGQIGALTSMAKDDQRFHVIKRSKPFCDADVCVKIYITISLEGGYGGGAQAAQVHRGHLWSLLWIQSHFGNDCGNVPKNTLRMHSVKCYSLIDDARAANERPTERQVWPCDAVRRCVGGWRLEINSFKDVGRTPAEFSEQESRAGPADRR